MADLNTPVPTPGDADYYDYVTKNGKYAPVKTTKKPVAKPTTKVLGSKPKSASEKMLETAEADAKRRKEQYSSGLAGMLGLK